MFEFVKEHIIYRFGIPQTITTDQGTIFTSNEFEEFANGMGIKLLNSSPYYAQANGQAEASNKWVIKLIKRNGRKTFQKIQKIHYGNFAFTENLFLSYVIRLLILCVKAVRAEDL